MFRMNNLIGVVSLLAIGLVTSTSRAEYQAVSGGTCQGVSGTFERSVYGIARLNAQYAGTGDLICPSVYGYTTADTSTFFKGALMTVYDRSTTGDVTCTFTITWADGTPQFTATRASTGIAQAGSVNLSWPNQAVTGVFGVFTCNLPLPTAQGASHIVGYSLKY